MEQRASPALDPQSGVGGLVFEQKAFVLQVASVQAGLTHVVKGECRLRGLGLRAQVSKRYSKYSPNPPLLQATAEFRCEKI